MKNIYEKINFDEIVQKIEDNKNMTYIDGYHEDPFTEIDYKKGVIEYYFEQEKENCDKIKEEIVEKKEEIEQKAKNIKERKNEIPQKIQECQDKFDKAFTNYKALNTFLSGLQVGSPKYIEIEEKIEELKETMNNAKNEKNDLYNENKKIVGEFENLDKEKEEYKKVIGSYNEKVNEVNKKIDSISYIDVKERPEKFNEEIKKEDETKTQENTNQQSQQQQESQEQSRNEQQSQQQAHHQQQPEQSLVDPSKQSKLKKMFDKIRQNAKEITNKITRKFGGKGISQEQIEANNSYIEKLSNIKRVFTDEERQNTENEIKQSTQEEQQVVQSTMEQEETEINENSTNDYIQKLNQIIDPIFKDDMDHQTPDDFRKMLREGVRNIVEIWEATTQKSKEIIKEFRERITQREEEKNMEDTQTR